MAIPESDEDAKQLEMLRLPVGEVGSGRARYAAAMHFFQRGQLSDEALEVYRILAKRDGDDPRAALDHAGCKDEATSL